MSSVSNNNNSSNYIFSSNPNAGFPDGTVNPLDATDPLGAALNGIAAAQAQQSTQSSSSANSTSSSSSTDGSSSVDSDSDSSGSVNSVSDDSNGGDDDSSPATSKGLSRMRRAADFNQQALIAQINSKTSSSVSPTQSDKSDNVKGI